VMGHVDLSPGRVFRLCRSIQRRLRVRALC
jgi:hypothetical protein